MTQDARLSIRIRKELKQNFDGYIMDIQKKDSRYSKSKWLEDVVKKTLKKAGRL